jgi:predicted DsbA family dithiol-disulfide isomerase
MPFELRPEPHPTLRPEGDYLQRAWQQAVYPLARRMGVPISLPPVSPQPHTHLAFEGYQYARELGKGNEYNRRILEAFFVEGQDIGQIDVLTRLAGEVGLNEKEFEEALRTRKYREAHRRALRHAYEEAGVTGVPMFVIGDQVLTGLQDRGTLGAVIEEESKAQGNAAQPGWFPNCTNTSSIPARFKRSTASSKSSRSQAASHVRSPRNSPSCERHLTLL